MPTNWYMILVAGLIPLAIGSIYYSPAVAGKQWMKVNGFTEESLEGGNMALIFGLTYLLSCAFALFIPQFTIHTVGFVQLMVEHASPGSPGYELYNSIMTDYGSQYRSFGHGALHGAIFSVLIALPLIAIVALFERRGGVYILIHWIYWMICSVLMSGLLCWLLKW